MNYLKTILLIGLLASLLGCANSNKHEDKLEEITSRTDTNSGFNDVFLKIISDSKKDSAHVYVAKGLFKGKTVGLTFEIKSNMPGGLNADGGMGSDCFISNQLK